MTKSKIKSLIVEMLLEALWGKRFIIKTIEKNGKHRRYIGLATANVKPNERPYRITWIDGETPLGHVDLTWEEVNKILEVKHFTPDIIARAENMWGPEAIAKQYYIEFFPDELKENTVINEGMSISVKGHNYHEDITSIGNLCWWLSEKVQLPIMKQMTPEEKSTIKSEIIVADGLDYDKQSGIISVYIGNFPEKWVPNLIGGIRYFLKNKNITTGTWKTDTSKMYNVDTIRIPIEDISHVTKNPAPSVSMSYGTANAVFNLLDCPEYKEYGINISVNTLLRKIHQFYDNDQYAGEHNLHYINQLNNMCDWAQNNGFDTITGG